MIFPLPQHYSFTAILLEIYEIKMKYFPTENPNNLNLHGYLNNPIRSRIEF